MSYTNPIVLSAYDGNDVDDTFSITFEVSESEYDVIKARLYKIEEPVGTPLDVIEEQTAPVLDGGGTYDYSILTSPLRVQTNNPIPAGYKVIFYRFTQAVSPIEYLDYRFPYQTVTFDFDRAYQVMQENQKAIADAGLFSFFPLDTAGTPFYNIIKNIITNETDIGGGGGGGSTAILSPINVLGVDIGSYEDGDTIVAGTEMEDILRNILTSVIPPTYVAPTLSISGTNPKTVESGTTITPTISPSYTANDAGTTLSYRVKRGATTVFTNPTPINQALPGYVIVDETVSITSEVDYDTGPVKNDNAGNPDPTGQITAGTVVSNAVNYSGVRKAFYGIDGDPVNIRTNSNDFLGVVDGSSFNVTGSGDTFVVSYPASLGALTDVTLTSSGFDFDITGDMTALADQMVNDASGGNPLTYKVYEYSPASSFTNATFTVTI